MDPYFAPARTNLATLYNRMGRNADAERVLREGVQWTPEQGELHYSLGLLLAEDRRLAEAAEALGQAARLLPDRARVRYNHALALQQLGRRREAEAALLAAHRLDQGDPQIVYALAVLFAREELWARALAYAQRLVALTPQDPAARQLVERLERQRAVNAPPR